MTDHIPEVVRVRPRFPEWEEPSKLTTFFAFLFAIILWVVLMVVFVIGLYAQWFARSLVYLLQLIRPKAYQVPFWFAVLMSIFLFPVTLVVILLSGFLRILKS